LNAGASGPKLAIINRRRFVLHVHAFLLEETTMTHLCNRAALSALLAGLIFAAPLAARPPETTIDDLRKDVRKMSEDIAALAKAVQLGGTAIKADMDDLKDRMSRLESDVRRVTRELDDLRSRPTTRGSLSVDPIGPATVAPVVPATGTVRLENRLGVTATAYIDGVAYSVPALSVVTLRGRPVGSFVYQTTAEGFGMRAPTRTSLAGGETLTLTIY
jgi:hypothetical protein